MISLESDQNRLDEARVLGTQRGGMKDFSSSPSANTHALGLAAPTLACDALKTGPAEGSSRAESLENCRGQS